MTQPSSLYIIFWTHRDQSEITGMTRPLTACDCVDWFKSMGCSMIVPQNVDTERAVHEQGGLLYYVKSADHQGGPT